MRAVERRRGMSPKGGGAYKDVYYVQNKSGLGYIDTGFKPNQNTQVVCEMIPTNASYIFGARNSAYVKNFGFYARASSGTARYDFGSNVYNGSPLHINTPWVCYNEGNVMYMTVEGSDYSITATSATFQCEHNMLLFGTNNNGTPSVSDCAKFISFKVYENGTLIRDYKPKQRIADGVYGLWDVVNSTFNTPPNGVTLTGGDNDVMLNYESITGNNSGKVQITSSNAFNKTRATLLKIKSSDNAISWSTGTPSSISSRYTLPHKESNSIKITLKNSSHYCAIAVYVRNGTTYTCPYSGGWTNGVLTADLSSYTGDEVWVSVNFKFNNAGNTNAILSDSDYTLEWL